MPLPTELLREVIPRTERPQNHHHMQVGDFCELGFVVLRGTGVVLHAHHALFEEMLQDGLARLLRDEHHDGGEVEVRCGMESWVFTVRSLSQNGHGIRFKRI